MKGYKLVWLMFVKLNSNVNVLVLQFLYQYRYGTLGVSAVTIISHTTPSKNNRG